jgi:anti-sigma factor (TIGR02949 family)
MNHPNCRQIQASVHDFLDGELPASSADFVTEHLQRCPECAHLVRFESAVRARIRDCCSTEAAPPELRVRIMTRITHVVTQVRVTYQERPGDVER